MSVLRCLWAVFAGLLIGGLVVGAIQLVGMLFFPLPVSMERFNAMTMDEKRELLHAGHPRHSLLCWLATPLACSSQAW